MDPQPPREKVTHDAFCAHLLRSINGMRAVVVADRDGVIVVSQGDSEAMRGAGALAATFSAAAEQANKLQMANCKSATTFSKDGAVVVYLNLAPLVVSLIGGQDMNVGLALDQADGICQALAPLRDSLKDTICHQ